MSKAARMPLSYANVWEDPEVLLRAMPRTAGARLLSIASGGDNALALLSLRPALVAAVDTNPVQLKMLELKAAAMRALEREDALVLLGCRPGPRRELFRAVRPALSPASRAWWDAGYPAIEEGLIHAGRFESYFAAFRRFVLPLTLGRGDLQTGRGLETESERRDFFKARVDTRRWRLLFRLFFSPALMSRLGRDPCAFRFVHEKPAPLLMRRVEHVLTVLDPRRNQFLEYVLTGSFGENLPFYLRPESYAVIRDNLDALRLVHGSVEDELSRADAGSFDAFNLSDVFEYMDDGEARRNWEWAARAGRRGGRLVYWNMMVPRQGSLVLPRRLRRLEELSERLFREDKVPFYRGFHVEEIL